MHPDRPSGLVANRHIGNRRTMQQDRPLSLVPSHYVKDGQRGDFEWEIQQELPPNARPPKGQRALRVFNDNTEHRLSCIRGGGNAKARQFNRFNPAFRDEPYSTGVTTGSVVFGGFSNLPSARKFIDADIAEVRRLARTGDYNRIVFSAEPDGSLGKGLFGGPNSRLPAPAERVRIYILRSLREVARELDQIRAQQGQARGLSL